MLLKCWKMARLSPTMRKVTYGGFYRGWTGDKFFRTDVRFRRPFLAGEPRASHDELLLLTRNALHFGRPSADGVKKNKKEAYPLFFHENSLRPGFSVAASFVNVARNVPSRPLRNGKKFIRECIRCEMLCLFCRV